MCILYDGRVYSVYIFVVYFTVADNDDDCVCISVSYDVYKRVLVSGHVVLTEREKKMFSPLFFF